MHKSQKICCLDWRASTPGEGEKGGYWRKHASLDVCTDKIFQNNYSTLALFWPTVFKLLQPIIDEFSDKFIFKFLNPLHYRSYFLFQSAPRIITIFHADNAAKNKCTSKRRTLSYPIIRMTNFDKSFCRSRISRIRIYSTWLAFK